MLDVAVLALVGFVCASAFRWPVMLLCAALVGAGTFVLLLSSGGGHVGEAAARAAAAATVLELAYLMGGVVMSLRLRGSGAKRNIRA